jgi:hypothetical protein
MRIDDLERLKLALDTRDESFYHDDIEHALREVVDELIRLRNEMGSYDVDDLKSLTESAEDLETAEARIKELVGSVAVLTQEWDLDSGGITGRPVSEGWVAEIEGTGVTVWGPTEYQATLNAYNLKSKMRGVLAARLPSA